MTTPDSRLPAPLHWRIAKGLYVDAALDSRGR
jgi:hypothetical protein